MNRSVAILATLWVLTAVGAVALVVGVAMFLGALASSQDLTWLFGVLAVVAFAFATMAVLIARRRPGNRVAWVLGAVGPLVLVTFGGFLVGAARFVSGGSTDLVGGLAALLGAAALGPTLFVAIPLLSILFPDGRLPGPRWRVPFWATVVAIALSSMAILVRQGPVNVELPDNPIGIEVEAVQAIAALAPPLPLGLLASMTLAIAAVATRARRSSGIERQQVKWLLASITAIAVVMPLSFVDTFLDDAGGFTVVDVLAIGSLALLPLSVGIAVLRYRLYDIDRIISRTLAYALLSGLLVATFGGLVVALQAALVGITRGDTIPVAVSTLVVFALFQPLRRRVQTVVARRFNRGRIDADRTVAAFGLRLRDELDLTTVVQDLVATVGDTVEPSRGSAWLRPLGRRS